jgi:hypothetical protein
MLDIEIHTPAALDPSLRSGGALPIYSLFEVISG